jgi:NADPH2:quinone reductase
VISSYATATERPSIPYWALGFKDTTLRLLGSDDFAPAIKAEAARVLTDALLVENGARGRVVIEVGR